LRFFTSLEPVALIAGIAFAAVLALNPRRSRLAAGLLLGFGIAGVIKGACTLLWIGGYGSPRAGAYLLVMAATLAIVAGLDLRASPNDVRERMSNGSMSTVVIAAILVCGAVVIPYRGTSTHSGTVTGKWQELAWEPVAIAVVAVAVGFLARRAGKRTLDGGVLIALGTVSLFYWLWLAGLPTVQFLRGINGIHPLPGAYVGVLGALLLISAGRRYASLGHLRDPSE
jgi:hypothetical protein